MAQPTSGHAPRAAFELDALLDAAEAVVLRDGIGRFTLDAVAAEARVSKGGLLHHYHSKEKLVIAMVQRIVDQWRSDVLAAVQEQPAGPGRIPRACIELALAKPACWEERCRRSSLVLMAAIVQCPTLVEPMRGFHKELLAMIADDGLPPGVGETVVLATDGLWLQWMFGLNTLEGERVSRLRRVLTGLVKDNSPPRRPRAVARSARKAGKS